MFVKPINMIWTIPMQDKKLLITGNAFILKDLMKSTLMYLNMNKNISKSFVSVS